tara:strand:+ start:1788 stop:2510 length:723 start_codon:yes stop_codon:yes gene_type:complete
MTLNTYRTLQYFYLTIRDRLALLGESNMNYQEATFMKDAQTVGQHIHSLLVSAGERYWDKFSGIATIPSGTEYSSLFPNDTDEVAMIRRIWVLDGSSGNILMPLRERRIGRSDKTTGTYPAYEVIDNKMYWFPVPVSTLSVKVEYVAAYDASPATGTWSEDNQNWGGATAANVVTKMGDKPDLPIYADDYFLNELTVRAALATGRDPGGWMNIAMRSRESMILNAGRDVPKRKHVLYKGY